MLTSLIPPNVFTVFENKDKIVIVMEYASRGDLYDYICDKKNISEREARHFFRQIVSAVHYCHQVSLFCFFVCFLNRSDLLKQKRSSHFQETGRMLFAGSVGSLHARLLRQTRCSAPCSVSGRRAPPELHNRHYSPSACRSEQGRCEIDAEALHW